MLEPGADAGRVGSVHPVPGSIDPPSQGRRLAHRDVVRIALPITVSNATTPFVGFADTVVIGQLGLAYLIGGVAVAANIFSFLYWMFGFLRMGTTGLTAQAVGARDRSEIAANLYRALLMALAGGGMMVLLQAPIADAAMRLMGGSADVEAAARTYYEIRIWGAPAGLVNFALLGWFIGLGRAAVAFWLQLLLNLVNITLAAVLVLVLGLGVAGVGSAALIADITAAVVGIGVAIRELGRWQASVGFAQVMDATRIKKAFAVNRDIMIRTFFVLAAMMFFTAQSAQTGELTLAANAMLHAIAMITVYLLDGFAFAAETLVGNAVGARDRERFRDAVRLSSLWAGVFGLVLTIIVWLAGPLIIAIMTSNTEIQAVAMRYLPWAALTPIVGVWCFQLDGIFIGATRTADMRNMMIISFVLYLAAWAVLKPLFGNDGLWAALMVLYIVRALTLLARYPALERAVSPAASTQEPMPRLSIPG